MIALGIVATGLSQPPQQTEALWTDGDSGRATFTANLAQPAATRACISDSVLGLGSRVRIYWAPPVTATGMTSSNVQYGRLENGVMRPLTATELNSVSTTGTTTEYTTQVQGALLSGLLGGTITIGLRFTNAQAWRSSWLTADVTVAILGLNPRCTIGSRP